jgi:hypothetical protein
MQFRGYLLKMLHVLQTGDTSITARAARQRRAFLGMLAMIGAHVRIAMTHAAAAQKYADELGEGVRLQEEFWEEERKHPEKRGTVEMLTKELDLERRSHNAERARAGAAGIAYAEQNVLFLGLVLIVMLLIPVDKAGYQFGQAIRGSHGQAGTFPGVDASRCRRCPGRASPAPPASWTAGCGRR